VIEHEVSDDADPALVCPVGELAEVLEASQSVVDPVVVGHVVPVVAKRTRVERTDPEGVDAEFVEVLDPLDRPRKSPHPSPSLSLNVLISSE